MDRKNDPNDGICGFARLEMERLRAGGGDSSRGEMVLRLRDVEELTREAPESVKLAEAFTWAAVAAARAGEQAIAARMLFEAHALSMRLPPSAALLKGYALGQLAHELSAAGALAEAEDICRLRLSLCGDVDMGPAPPELGVADFEAYVRDEEHRARWSAIESALRSYGEVLGAMGRWAEAEAMCRRELAFARRRRAERGSHDYALALQLGRLANACAEQGKLDEGAALLEEALAEAKAVSPDPDAWYACDYLVALGSIRRKQGRLNDAEALEREAIRRYRKQARSFDEVGNAEASARFEARAAAIEKAARD